MKMKHLTSDRDFIIDIAWKQWREHLDECEHCRELADVANEMEGEERGMRWFMLGFSACMDLVEGRQLIPSDMKNN
jgi:hypothetical protein